MRVINFFCKYWYILPACLLLVLWLSLLAPKSNEHYNYQMKEKYNREAAFIHKEPEYFYNDTIDDEN